MADAVAAKRDPAWTRAIDKGLTWVAQTQSNLGHWTSGNPGPYPTAMTALGATALICAGATTTQGPFARHIRRAVDFLVQKKARPNGLIGDPLTDNRYTYGHGFSMLFLSQVLGEEEDRDRRSELVDVLTRAVEFSVRAQTKSGGWGYVSAKDGNNFDEGSTTITQVQGVARVSQRGHRGARRRHRPGQELYLSMQEQRWGHLLQFTQSRQLPPRDYRRCVGVAVQCRRLR